MKRTLVTTVVLQLTLALGICAVAIAGPDTVSDEPTPDPEARQCVLADHVRAQIEADRAVPAGKQANPSASALHPKVVFQINQANDAPTILRFVTNFLIAEPAARVVVVGYGGGVDFMLKGAKDAGGKPYADQLQTLANKGVCFKVCNNTLKARNLTADAVSPPAMVVAGAVNEIIRLQAREGYAYFRH